MKLKQLPSQEILRAALAYNQDTGVFVWRIRDDVPPWWNPKFAGKVAGAKGGKGVYIFVNSTPYLAHRLAWVYMNGPIPDGMLIDHKNCNQYDNRIANLRLATHGQNGSNSRLKRGKALPKGVSKQLSGGYKAVIGVDKKIIYLGTFKTPAEAHAAYVAAAKSAKGEFARAS